MPMKKFFVVLALAPLLASRPAAPSVGESPHGHTGHAVHKLVSLAGLPSVFDEATFYELWLSESLTRKHLEHYMRQYNPTFNRLSDRQFNMIMEQWIFQMLPGSS